VTATVLLLAALSAFVAQGRAAPPPDDLAAAKALYAQGTYEDALARLNTIHGDATANDVDEYRALCYLALGKTAETQHALESLFGRSPLFKMSDADVPPRLVAMYHDVRRRLLPAAVRSEYAKAKTNFDQKNYSAATTGFTDLLLLINDDDLGDEAAALADLKMLGEGFLNLASIEQQKADAAAAAAKAAASAPPVTPKPEPPPQPAPATSTPPDNGPKIYTDADRDVTPPSDISRPLPEWNPTNPQWRKFELRGAIRIIVDENGKVESVSLVQSVHESYDPLLLAAARQWTFKPAMKNGQPVKFLKIVAVLLSPR